MADTALKRVQQARIVWLDVLRGLALFGIAQINFPSFATGLQQMSSLYPAHDAHLHVVNVLLTLFVETKFYPVFAFLFGYGHTLQRRNLLAAGIDPAQVLRRRYGALLALGVLHGLLLFFGDILTMYALAGFVLLIYRDDTLARVRSSIWRWAGVSVLMMSVVALAQPDYPNDIHASWVELFHGDIVLLEQGDWRTVVIERAVFYLETQLFQAGTFLPQVLLFMSAGMWAAERGVLSDPKAFRPLFVRLVGIGLVLGAPIGVALTVLQQAVIDERAAPIRIINLLEDCGFFMSLFYLGVFGHIAAWLDGKPQVAPVRWLAALGRMALTNYLSQSLVMMAVWYLGFRAIVTVGAPVALAELAGLTCMIQLCSSSLLLRHFRQGPMEALWRRVTYGRLDASI